MCTVWGGWKVEWAHEEFTDLWRHLGIVVERSPHDWEEELVQTLPPPNPNWFGTLVSIRHEDGRLTVLRACDHAERVLPLGPALLDLLRQEPERSTDVACPEMPVGGAHVDVHSRTLEFWNAYPMAGFPREVERAWDGWTATWLTDVFERHAALLRGAFEFPIESEAKRIARLRSILESLAPQATACAPAPPQRAEISMRAVAGFLELRHR